MRGFTVTGAERKDGERKHEGRFRELEVRGGLSGYAALFPRKTARADGAIPPDDEHKGGERILDLGGRPSFWEGFHSDLDITVANLPGKTHLREAERFPHIRCLTGDACDMRGHGDKTFDICFSNSVIEHVGGPERQRAFAREVRRLADKYWVQTPSIWFPIEAHTYMPFWWLLPAPVQRAFRRRWARTRPKWNTYIEATTVIRHGELRDMFPDARIWTERFMWFPKSYIAFRA